MPKSFVISKTHVTIVDEEDADLLTLFSWHVQKKGLTYYAHRVVDQHKETRRTEFLHLAILARILGRPPQAGEIADHKNRNGLDNRRGNLRVATPLQNTMNSGPKGGGSAYKGVSPHGRTGLWTAKISPNGKAIHLGHYTSEESAAMQYDQAAYFYFGEVDCAFLAPISAL